MNEKYKYLLKNILKNNPNLLDEHIMDIRMINEWDILIVFGNGSKEIYDRYNGSCIKIFYNDINELTDEQEMQGFAYNLRRIMKHRSINQDELSDRVGTSRCSISRYLNGTNLPNAIILRKIAKELDCSMDDFFYYKYI